MSERLRAPPAAYTNDEVGQILKRAAGLQREVGVPGATLTQSEIEQIALDAGIDPSQVRQAIGELYEEKKSSTAKMWLGAPTRLSVERIIPGELEPRHHEALATAVRTLMQNTNAGPGIVSSVGRTLTYVVPDRKSPVEISFTVIGGNTVVRIDANLGQFAGGIFGGIGGGLGISGGVNLAWILPAIAGTSLPVAAAACAGFMGLTWLGCRWIYGAFSRSQNRKAARLADALEQQVKGLISVYSVNPP